MAAASEGPAAAGGGTRVEVVEESSADAGAADVYNFELITPLELPALHGRDVRERWLKWGLAPKVVRLRLTGRSWRGWDVSSVLGGDRASEEAQSLLTDLFNSPVLRGAFRLTGRGGADAPLAGLVSRVRFSRCGVRATSLALFDRLAEEPLCAVTPGEPGYIRQQLEEEYEGVQVGDKLREAILVDSSEAYEAFSEEERNETLFQLFRWVVTGGAMCQYEDTWAAYLDAVKGLMRDLLTVVKAPPGGGAGGASGLQVVSSVFRVEALEGEGGARLPLFPISSPHNACWVVADPVKRTATLLYSPFLSFW